MRARCIYVCVHLYIYTSLNIACFVDHDLYNQDAKFLDDMKSSGMELNYSGSRLIHTFWQGRVGSGMLMQTEDCVCIPAEGELHTGHKKCNYSLDKQNMEHSCSVKLWNSWRGYNDGVYI